MVMIANYLALKKVKLSLLEPCFDNIYDILKNMDIVLDKPLLEEWLHDPEKIYDNLAEHIDAEALLIVEPNNPTGFTLGGATQVTDNRKNSYNELIRYAKDYNKLLIFDFCFSSFLIEDAEPASFDIYKELEASGVSYIIVEDTGKTWPLQDTKVAMLKTSKDLYQDLFDIHTSYLLNVSPFILNLVTQYVIDSEKDHFSSVFTLLKCNREIAREVLSGSLLELQDSMSNVSVAWFKIKDTPIKATELQKRILQEGVYILPGTYFFWSDHSKGEGFMRIALARDTDLFDEAIRKLRFVLDEIESTLN
jgi:aspartate/methionine/tyrosine aminotransferase